MLIEPHLIIVSYPSRRQRDPVCCSLHTSLCTLLTTLAALHHRSADQAGNFSATIKALCKDGSHIYREFKVAAGSFKRNPSVDHASNLLLIRRARRNSFLTMYLRLLGWYVLASSFVREAAAQYNYVGGVPLRTPGKCPNGTVYGNVTTVQNCCGIGQQWVHTPGGLSYCCQNGTSTYRVFD